MTGDPTQDVDAFPAGVASNFTVGSRIAGYRLEQMIGRGGMAMVFRAVDERLGRQVALKILAPALAENRAFRQRFVGESRMAAAVDDPHIIPVHEAGEAAGVLFIAMRYVPGGDVRTLLRHSGPMSAARAAAIISPVASALDAAHAVGLIHRDVKPANMLLDARAGRPDHVYLSDFGLSKESVSPSGLTQTGQILGTPAYSAPEQIEGRPLDGRADQYSLACATFELLTGAPPFVQTQVTALILAQMSTPPPTLTSRRPDLPVAADHVFASALAKKPDDRYANCREFADDLRHAFGLVPYDSGPGIIVPQQRHPTEVASPGGTITHELAAQDGRAGDSPTNVITDRARTGSGQDGAGEQLAPPPAEVSPARSTTPHVEIPTGEQSGRRSAAASWLIILAAFAAIGSYMFPGQLTAATKIAIVPYLSAIFLAVWLLVGKRRAVVAAILLGLWAPAVGWLAADIVAVAVDHSLDKTGSALVSFYVGDLSDVFGVTAVLLLWSVWRSNARARAPQSRRGMPTVLLSGVGLIVIAQLMIFVISGGDSSNNYSAFYYMFGIAALVVGLAATWIATSISNRISGGALLLGWTTTTVAVLLGLMTEWSLFPGPAKVSGVLTLLLLFVFIVLTIAYMTRRSHKDTGGGARSVAA